MKNSARWATMAALVALGATSPPGCRTFSGSFCVDAGASGHGLVITQNATIEFETNPEGLRLTVNDNRSGAQTILDLPSANPQQQD